MNESQLRNFFVSTAKAYLGATKGSAKHHEIVDIYNTISPRPRGYKLTYSDDWCAGFVSAMSKKCDLLSIIPAEVAAHRLYQNMSTHKDRNYTPKIGDIILYDWDSNNWADHIGIVCECSAGAITVIEGNTSGGKVAYRSIAVGSKLILGFGLPNYASKATATAAQPIQNTVATAAPKSAEIAVDGAWGSATTKRIQQVLGCTVDGVCGPQTIKALQKWAGMAAKDQDGIRGPKTNKAMQTKLNALGASPKLVVDGDFGFKSVTALQKWLNKQ